MEPCRLQSRQIVVRSVKCLRNICSLHTGHVVQRMRSAANALSKAALQQQQRVIADVIQSVCVSVCLW